MFHLIYSSYILMCMTFFGNAQFLDKYNTSISAPSSIPKILSPPNPVDTSAKRSSIENEEQMGGRQSACDKIFRLKIRGKQTLNEASSISNFMAKGSKTGENMRRKRQALESPNPVVPPTIVPSLITVEPLVTTEPSVTTRLPIVSEPPITAGPPVTTKSPVSGPPTTTEHPTTARTPVTTQPPVSTEPPVSAGPPVTTRPPVTTKPPVTIRSPVTTTRHPVPRFPVTTTRRPVPISPVTTRPPITRSRITTKTPVTTGLPITRSRVTTKAPVTTRPPITRSRVTTKAPVTPKQISPDSNDEKKGKTDSWFALFGSFVSKIFKKILGYFF